MNFCMNLNNFELKLKFKQALIKNFKVTIKKQIRFRFYEFSKQKYIILKILVFVQAGYFVGLENYFRCRFFLYLVSHGNNLKMLT